MAQERLKSERNREYNELLKLWKRNAFHRLATTRNKYVTKYKVQTYNILGWYVENALRKITFHFDCMNWMLANLNESEDAY